MGAQLAVTHEESFGAPKIVSLRASCVGRPADQGGRIGEPTTSARNRTSFARCDSTRASVRRRGTSLWFTTHANGRSGRMAVRARSAWSCAASWTCVDWGSVTRRIFVNARSRGRGRYCRTSPGAGPPMRSTSRWYVSAASRSRNVCPVGAVSTTTKPCSPAATTSTKARKTVISSVHGLRRSSSRSTQPAASRPS